jgi:hypothetical protein
VMECIASQSNQTPVPTPMVSGLTRLQSLPPRALAVSASAPGGGGSSWSHTHSILQLWAEVKQGCGLSTLTGAQHLLAYPGGCDLHGGPQTALVGGHQQAGKCTPKRADGLDGAQGFDGADAGAASLCQFRLRWDWSLAVQM